MPKPASVRDLMLQNPRERLLVQPLEWTELHLKLLNCYFLEVKPDEMSEDSHDEASEASGAKKSVDRDARTAERLATTEMKNTAVKKLVAEDGGPLRLQRPFGYFCFGMKHEIRLHGAVFSMRDTKNLGCVFAFIQKQMITIQRESVFTLPRPRRPNPPAELVRELKLKQLEPADQWREPYLLAVLIGLAQTQAEEKRNPKYPFAEDHIFKTCCVFTDDFNKEFMYFYSAKVSVAFLSKFEYPRTLMKPKDAMSSELALQMKKIPFQPYPSLKKRLLTEIYVACGDQIQLTLRNGKPQE